MDFVAGPDFPTGGVIVDGPEAIAHAYATGKGAFRVRAKWETEDQGRGTWTAVISEIPFQVQKGKLIEQIAALIAEKKLPILADEIGRASWRARVGQAGYISAGAVYLKKK